jgi:prepilin-type N-terminal cleavage/methylation domain-containing protein
MQTHWQRRQTGGFTLVEIMIVVAILGLLSVLALPSLRKARQTSITQKCIQNQRMVFQAVIRYEMDYGQTLHAIRNNGVTIRNTLLAAGFINIQQAFECSASQTKDNDDVRLLYRDQDFLGPTCTIVSTHVFQ